MNGHHNSPDPSIIELWSPGVLLFTIAIIAAYLAVTGSHRHRFSDSEPVPVKQKTYFILGAVIFYIAQGSPLAYYGHHFLFSAHMFQQSLLFFFVPPFMLLGLPSWFFSGVHKNASIYRVVRIFTQPLIAIFLFNMLLTAYHVPQIFDFVMMSPLWGPLFNLVLQISAFVMWFLIITPDPKLERLTPLQKMAYIIVNALLLYPICAIIIFAGKPLFAAYIGVPQIFESLPTLYDQQLAGVLMKLMQEGALGFALSLTFYQWYRSENKTGDNDLNPKVDS